MSGAVSNMLEMVLVIMIILLALLVWFFVNRASVRANEQIRLLQEIVKQQKKQLALMQTLIPVPPSTEPVQEAKQEEDDTDVYFRNVIPER
ncbi:YebO family protein [Lonsdalea quercina]|uniref:YebO-like protein n=1 Tax=Lonsdalea quercina TaxID=71657 RepID=A0A1H3XHN3_9GAMM|nr:YebO family protein [Lonsdalea quercina]SDZ98859.1 YebO-like protein [Lonsdalea quercina]